jgi:hypothetical protein
LQTGTGLQTGGLIIGGCGLGLGLGWGFVILGGEQTTFFFVFVKRHA